MLQVYLAGRYRWAAQIETVACSFRELPGVSVISEWHGWNPPGWMTLEQVTSAARKMDVDGVRGCDVFIFFRKAPRVPVRLTPAEVIRGGRYIELGMAMALGKKIIAFGNVPRKELSVFEEGIEVTVFSVLSPMLGLVGDLAEAF